MNKWSFLEDNWYIIVILIMYSILAIFSLQYFQYKIAGDEISYINIAHAYVLGHWGNAINGYWSPLYSWLMIPFLLIFGIKPLYAVYITKAVSIIIGFLTILSVKRLSQTFNLDKTVERALLFAIVPSIVFFSLLYNTPDLLLALLLILYLSILFNLEYSKNIKYGMVCGLIGAAAYLTKSYAFPFFLLHYLLFNMIFYFKNHLQFEKKIILKNLLLGLSIFFIVSGLWAATISEKYGKLTISTAGEYNQALVGPEYRDNMMDNGISPLYYMGLIQPPNNDTTSIWGDLSYQKMDRWSPLTSWKNFEYEVYLIGNNIGYTFNILESFMPVAILILIFMVLILVSRIDVISKNIIKYLLLTMLIYIGGYCLIIPEWRYLWFIFVLLMVSSFLMVDRLYKSHILKLELRNILLILLIVSFILLPTLQATFFANQKDESYALSNVLKAEYNIHGNIASNSWDSTSTIAYYLDSKYYGSTKKTEDLNQLNKELTGNNIDYYFVWNNTEDLNLSDYHEITNGNIVGLRIYSK